MKRALLVLFTVVAATLVASCAAALPEPASASPCVPIQQTTHNLAYGPSPLQRLDVYPAPADECGQNPVVVWVHGGGWRAGDKAHNVVDKVAWAHEHGWTLVAVNYRLTSPDNDIRYPTHNRDVGRALEWLTAHIAAYGGDAGHLGLLGHSAGAQIVSSLGTMARFTDAEVDCFASLDTEGYDVEARIEGGGRGALLYRLVFGNRRVVWRDASPINHVDSGDPAELVVRRGSPSRQLQQARFAMALRQAGVPTTVVRTIGYSHGDVNDAVGTDDRLTPALTGFYDGCFT
jgi:arylformamidase